MQVYSKHHARRDRSVSPHLPSTDNMAADKAAAHSPAPWSSPRAFAIRMADAADEVLAASGAEDVDVDCEPESTGEDVQRRLLMWRVSGLEGQGRVSLSQLVATDGEESNDYSLFMQSMTNATAITDMD